MTHHFCMDHVSLSVSISLDPVPLSHTMDHAYLLISLDRTHLPVALDHAHLYSDFSCDILTFEIMTGIVIFEYLCKYSDWMTSANTVTDRVRGTDAVVLKCTSTCISSSQSYYNFSNMQIIRFLGVAVSSEAFRTIPFNLRQHHRLYCYNIDLKPIISIGGVCYGDDDMACDDMACSMLNENQTCIISESHLTGQYELA